MTPGNGLRERAAQDWRICPTCSKDNALRVTVAEGQRHYRCIFCPHVHSDPVPQRAKSPVPA